MKPIYSVIANNQDITGKFRSNLVSISVTDEMSPQSDTVRITLSDKESRIALIKVGTLIEVSLGYEYANGEQVLSRVGRFIIDEIEVNGPPTQLVIVGRSTNFTDHLKSCRNRSFKQVSFGDLVRQIASENGLKAHIADPFDNILIDHVDQADESDLHFMNRLAKQYDAVLKPVVDDLLLVPHDKSETVKGTTVPVKSIHADKVTRWSIKLPKRTEFGHVKGYWRSDDAGKRQTYIVGDRTKAGKALQTTFSTQAEAQAAVEGEFNKLQRGVRSLNLTLHGDPELFAERPIRISGTHPLGDGEYVCKQVTHSLSNGGFTTNVSAS